MFFLVLALVAILFRAIEPFRSPKGYFCEIILKSGHLPARCRLNVFLFLALAAILFSGSKPF